MGRPHGLSLVTQNKQPLLTKRKVRDAERRRPAAHLAEELEAAVALRVGSPVNDGVATRGADGVALNMKFAELCIR